MRSLFGAIVTWEKIEGQFMRTSTSRSSIFIKDSCQLRLDIEYAINNSFLQNKVMQKNGGAKMILIFFAEEELVQRSKKRKENDGKKG